MKNLNKLKSKGPYVTTPKPFNATMVSTQPAAGKAKTKSKAGKLVDKLGGADSILSTGGELIGKAGAYIASRKAKATGGNDFDLGVGEPQEPSSGDIFGVPKASFWTIVGVVTLIILSFAFFIGSRK